MLITLTTTQQQLPLQVPLPLLQARASENHAVTILITPLASVALTVVTWITMLTLSDLLNLLLSFLLVIYPHIVYGRSGRL
jgi:uncharacterized RDD family membrane protein YckC